MYKDLKVNVYKTTPNLYGRYKSVIRFIIVGCINTGVDFLTFTILYSFLGGAKLACQVGGYSMGIVNSFILNKLWTFKESKSKVNATTQFIKFVFVNIISLTISLIGLNLLNGEENINIYISKVIVTGFLQIFNYVLYKGIIFQDKKVLEDNKRVR